MSKSGTYVESMRAIFGGVRWLLTPRYRFGEPVPEVTWLERGRAILGIVIAAAAGTLYLPINMDAVNGSMDGLMTNVLFALPAVAVGMTVVIFSASRGSRLEVVYTMWKPALTMLIFIGITVIMSFIIRPITRNAFNDPGVLGVILGIPFLIAVLIYLMPTIMYALYLGARHWFNAADAHPLLPALASIIFAVATFGYNVYLAVTSGLDPQVPAVMAFLLTFGGPPSMIAVAIFEIKLSQRRGIRFGQVPQKTPEF